MRRLILAVMTCLMASSAIVLAGGDDSAVRLVIAPKHLELRQTPSASASVETKSWMERHPVWFGVIAGASGGAAWGALSCHNGCMIGASGAAMYGSWWGAGAGALIGWAAGRAR